LIKIGKRLRFYRKQCGLSIYDVEKITGISFGLVASYERGDKKPSISTVKKLAGVYSVSPVYIFESEDEIISCLPQEVRSNIAFLISNPEINDLVKSLKYIHNDTLKHIIELVKILAYTQNKQSQSSKI